MYMILAYGAEKDGIGVNKRKNTELIDVAF